MGKDVSGMDMLIMCFTEPLDGYDYEGWNNGHGINMIGFPLDLADHAPYREDYCDGACSLRAIIISRY